MSKSINSPTQATGLAPYYVRRPPPNDPRYSAPSGPVWFPYQYVESNNSPNECNTPPTFFNQSLLSPPQSYISTTYSSTNYVHVPQHSPQLYDCSYYGSSPVPCASIPGCPVEFPPWDPPKSPYDIQRRVIRTTPNRITFKFIMDNLTQSVSKDDRWILYEFLSDSSRLLHFVHSLHGAQLQQLIDMVCDKIDVLGTDKRGCKVVQKLMGILDDDPLRQFLFDQIVEAIINPNHLVTLMRNASGNYLVQDCIKQGTPQQIRRLFEIGVKGNVMTLSLDKFASNVVERVIEKFSHDEHTKYVVDKMSHEVLKFKSEQNDGETGVSILLKDMYGNYVFQNLVKNCRPKRRFELIQETMQHKKEVARFRYARAITENLEAYLRTLRVKADETESKNSV